MKDKNKQEGKDKSFCLLIIAIWIFGLIKVLFF
jgi:hypothetical protein